MCESFLLSSTLLISLHTHTNEKVKHDDTTRKTFSCDLVEVLPFCHFDIHLYTLYTEVSKRLSGAIVNVLLLYLPCSLSVYAFSCSVLVIFSI